MDTVSTTDRPVQLVVQVARVGAVAADGTVRIAVISEEDEEDETEEEWVGMEAVDTTTNTTTVKATAAAVGRRW